MANARIAVLIPCYNESATLEQVITDFKREVPQSVIYVYDNNSTDNSVAVAKAAGAVVKHVSLRGKGQVVRRMFADVDADVYVMVDGDATYDATCAQKAIDRLQRDDLDMVVCARSYYTDESFRPGHVFGNQVFTRMVNLLFGRQTKDIFSGYRAFSRRFVKSFPAISQGFEIEAEITIHALQLGIPTGEIDTAYQARPEGSDSKLRTIKDGLRILKTVSLLFLYIRPMTVFGWLFAMLALSSLILGIPIVIEFAHTGLVPRLPTAVLAASLGMLACFAFACGIVLDSVSRARLEAKRCWYLLAASV